MKNFKNEDQKFSSKDELERLISMAEDVSRNLHEAHRSMTMHRGAIFVYTLSFLVVLTGFSFVFQTMELFANPSYATAGWFVVFVFSVFFILLFLYHYGRLMESRRIFVTERNVLMHLLDLVFEYKDHIHVNELSAVDKAILDIRLGRVRFFMAE